MNENDLRTVMTDELAALLKVATPADFGPTVLRAETAAIFALSVLAASRHASLAPRSKV